MSCRPLLALSGGVSSAASSHGTTGRSEAFRGNGRCSATPIRHPFRQFQYPTSPEHADLALKEKALARTAPLEAIPGRYQPTDTHHDLPRQPVTMPTCCTETAPPTAPPSGRSA